MNLYDLINTIECPHILHISNRTYSLTVESFSASISYPPEYVPVEFILKHLNENNNLNRLEEYAHIIENTSQQDIINYDEATLIINNSLNILKDIHPYFKYDLCAISFMLSEILLFKYKSTNDRYISHLLKRYNRKYDYKKILAYYEYDNELVNTTFFDTETKHINTLLDIFISYITNNLLKNDLYLPATKFISKLNYIKNNYHDALSSYNFSIVEYHFKELNNPSNISETAQYNNKYFCSLFHIKDVFTECITSLFPMIKEYPQISMAYWILMFTSKYEHIMYTLFQKSNAVTQVPLFKHLYDEHSSYVISFDLDNFFSPAYADSPAKNSPTSNESNYGILFGSSELKDNIYESLKKLDSPNHDVDEMVSALNASYPNINQGLSETQFNIYNFCQSVYVEMFTYYFITTNFNPNIFVKQCKNPKCNAIFTTDSTSPYCPKCRNDKYIIQKTYSYNRYTSNLSIPAVKIKRTYYNRYYKYLRNNNDPSLKNDFDNWNSRANSLLQKYQDGIITLDIFEKELPANKNTEPVLYHRQKEALKTKKSSLIRNTTK